ncbi:hypothetical protein Pogu_2131 [Pyrobaculum oguniense TE7]|uniref:Uncharacterized protein n=1 Tax=Pyrobaculum oguniense (strain DSM 13380 / JCM 10595 / TE7) TaxID=698757 RepID=H6QCW2_PYROT|nr:hypothetical protein Pogu_2131 [Pyrobaculum oguniense TE7]
MTHIEEARRAVNNIVAGLMLKDPFLALLLRRTTIVAVDGDVVAYTDGIRIFLNPEKWLGLPEKDRTFVLLHELMHIVLRHVPRWKQLSARYPLEERVYNFVMDAKANQELEMYATGLTLEIIMPVDVEETFGVKNVEEKSVEEIIREIHNRNPNKPLKQFIHDIGVPKSDGGSGVVAGDGADGRVVIQEGDEPAGKPLSTAEVEERVIKKVVEAVMALRAAGRDPGRWERLLELLKPKVDWRRLLRATLVKGLGHSVKRTWMRPSRKLPGVYPGKELWRYGKIVIMVDASGSIGEKELSQFMSEVYAAAKEVEHVVAVIWDTIVQQEFEIRRYTDIRKLKVKGGGGTLIRPVLEYVFERHRDASMFVILSDWEIGDVDEARVLLRQIARKTIAVTTHRDPPKLPFYVVIRI